jgi:hypothetical protein
MRRARRRASGSARPLGVTAALLLLAGLQGGLPARAADADPDEDLLEFLGGVGGEDADFADYLGQNDIAKPAHGKPVPPPPPTGPRKS